MLKTPLNGRYNLIEFFVFVFSLFWRYSIKFDYKTNKPLQNNGLKVLEVK